MKQLAAYTLLYADSDIVVLNKQAGFLTAADRYDPEASRVDTEAQKEFGTLFAVHRLDKDTSGALIYARTPQAQRELSIQFEQRKIKKSIMPSLRAGLKKTAFIPSHPSFPMGTAGTEPLCTGSGGSHPALTSDCLPAQAPSHGLKPARLPAASTRYAPTSTSSAIP